MLTLTGAIKSGFSSCQRTENAASVLHSLLKCSIENVDAPLLRQNIQVN